MIKITNDIIPFKGYKAIALWPFVFVRSDASRFDACDERHERTHLHQQLEMLLVGAAIAGILTIFNCGWWSLLALPIYFYWYGLEYIGRIIFAGQNPHQAYRNLLMEVEAYSHETEQYYLDNRKPFAWLFGG